MTKKKVSTVVFESVSVGKSIGDILREAFEKVDVDGNIVVFIFMSSSVYDAVVKEDRRSLKGVKRCVPTFFGVPVRVLDDKELDDVRDDCPGYIIFVNNFGDVYRLNVHF
jgi:hypothetical protein